MKKSFCDHCGKEVSQSEGIQMLEIKTSFWVKERSFTTNARESGLDFCNPSCLSTALGSWMEKQLNSQRQRP